MRVPELAEHRGLRHRQVVGKHAQEGAIAHGVGGAEDGVTEPAGRRLMRHGDAAEVSRPAYDLELGQLAPVLEEMLELRIRAKVPRKGLLALGEDEHDLVGSRGHRLLGRPLDDRAIGAREHLLGKLLGGGEEARSQARGRIAHSRECAATHCRRSGTRPCSRYPCADA